MIMDALDELSLDCRDDFVKNLLGFINHEEIKTTSQHPGSLLLVGHNPSSKTSSLAKPSQSSLTLPGTSKTS